MPEGSAKCGYITVAGFIVQLQIEMQLQMQMQMQIVHPGGNEKISLYNNVDYEENAASKFILAITTRINNKAVASHTGKAGQLLKSALM